MVFDVTEQDFEQRVIERSRELPVVVDFWAEWCGPCRTLTPALEEAANRRNGDVELAKLDTDANPSISQAFGIRGIPAVKAFKDGKIVAEFTGAIPPAQVEEFFNQLAPSQAGKLAQAGDEESLRKALELDPRQVEAAQKLARILLSRGETKEPAELLEPFPGDFIASGLLARAQLAGDAAARSDDPSRLSGAFAAWDAGEHERALEALQDEFTAAEDDETKRRVMVAIFTELGADHPLAREHRRRLAAVLS